MKISDGILLLAGSMVTISVLLSYFVDSRFMLLTLLIGVNLIQTAFTKWCPLINFFRKRGFTD
ncbi:DUF2892 domain-containing protein [Pseudoalteromonas sp. NEC-BIFX-2020_002]|uniref:DUF2892 domain-containing protein n=1 Tax=Pseudoalteromonas neustonica TaxID=1840331 RepID=A0ABU9U5F6_9GAMM|nr:MULTISPECIES: DUF2892 domain-containing protein [Pseudoalteromonas]NMR27143.1 DUF2892 domain-containing protein [Pseudoalteromonas sp. NEC-BIFX-2020_015]NNG44832.1 DUF2892 domain-containing protein [Pseudoalteromonas sp. NEC-BIFX-2020_002]